MLRLLVSVRDAEEARRAAEAGADFIDCKEPADGALGALAPERIEEIVAVLRAQHPGRRVSATMGDVAPQRVAEILARVRRVARCGVDFVKVGVWRSPAAPALLDALATCDAAIIPVLVVDEGLDTELVDQALRCAAFPALMVDTAEKGRGSLLQRVPLPTLSRFIADVRAHGVLAGVAGSLRFEDAPALRALAPDFAGFRGAVTRGARAGALDPARVRELRGRLAPGPRAALPARA